MLGDSFQEPLQKGEASSSPDSNSNNTKSLLFHDLLMSLIIFSIFLVGIAIFYLTYKIICWICQKQNHSQKETDLPRFTRGFLNKTANLCFANALLTCLFHLPEFTDQIKEISRRDPSNKIVNKLAQLFKEMTASPDNFSYSVVEDSKNEFFQEVKESEPQVFRQEGGDSRTLFQVLCQNVPKLETLDKNLFFFVYEKTVYCKKCLSVESQDSKKFTEGKYYLDISEDYYWKKTSLQNFYQPEIVQRKCNTCQMQTHHTTRFTLTSFPRILAIRIGDSPKLSLPQRGLAPHIELELGNQEIGKRSFRFLAGVYNTNRGEEGGHSVAYIYKNGRNRQGSFLCYNDSYVKCVNYEEIRGFPKLLFYVPCNDDRQIDIWD